MDKKVIAFMEEKTKELIAAPTCSKETCEAANAWLQAIGTDNEEVETQKYIEKLKEDIMPIDTLIDFASSKEGKEYFGEETANNIVTHAKEIKGAGAKYCDCPACKAVEAILEKVQ